MNRTTIKEYLAQLICEAMYMDITELEADELFSDFGLESITLVKILTKVNERYAVQIKIEELVANQTLNEASTYIFQQVNV